MKWNDYPENPPKESGTYLVSITKKYFDRGDFTFKYVAYFDAVTNTWHKNDFFDDTNEILEVIEHRVNGWASELPIYLR